MDHHCPKLKTHSPKTSKGKLLKFEAGVSRQRTRATFLWGRAGDKEGKHACEGLELVFQVKLLLSQNTEVYLQVRANGIFFNCLADLENFISDCFWSRTYKSHSKQGSSCAVHVKTQPVTQQFLYPNTESQSIKTPFFPRGFRDTVSLYSLYWPWNHNSPA